ncbi:MAG: hypothetical protein SWO11_04295 [Thermodesulfobacteriota bacterium]|nr:hypothetical protein [Thermodesulfobacteriota bacterium]
MSESKNVILVRANVEMTSASLQAIVQNTKKIAGKNDKGYYTVDTADKVGEMISRFLLEKDFESFAKNIENYKD